MKQTVEVAQKVGLLKKTALKEVIVDTTVQEKNISYPTDGKLINKARDHLVEEAKREGISLRQSYKIKGKKEKAQSDRYFHAKQYKRGESISEKTEELVGTSDKRHKEEMSRRHTGEIKKSLGNRTEDI